MKDIGYRLAEARKNCGMTQAEAAEKLYITAASISSWERGNSIPDTEKIPEIAELYDVSLEWLLTGKLPPAEIIEVTSNLSDRLFNEVRMAAYITAYCDARGLLQTKRALALAKNKHDGQFRKSSKGSSERIPYIYHPLLLTCHALALGLIEDSLLAACLLHDVCEDCGVEPEELPVGEEAREAVRLLTKPVFFGKTEPEEIEYYGAIAGNRIAVMVKLLDRCNNISGMASCFTDEHMAEYIKETQTYIHPLMEKARHDFPEYSNQLFLIKYHMNSVIGALQHHMRSSL